MNNISGKNITRQNAGGMYKFAFLVLLLVTLSQSVICQTSQLTPIGSTLASITNTDDANQNVSITGVFTGGIQFGATVYTSMYVSSNGYVTFGHGNSGYSPLGIAAYSLGPIIAAQYDDLHPGVAGDIYYSQNTDYVVVTYSGVAPYRSPTGVGSGYNTFQIVLRKAAGYNGSSNLNFTIEIRYISLNWAKSGNNSAWPTAGWSTGTQLVYSVLPYSGTSSFLSNASSTNCGSSGIFNYAVQGGVVQSPPTVITTTTVSSITGTSGISGGNVSADGGQTVSERGLVYSTSQLPTVSNSKVTSGSGTGTFTATMTGLNTGTTYYVRSYATNSLGTGYGPQVSFTTSSVSAPTVTTTAISAITTTSATSGYTVTSNGGATVTAQGVCWNTGGSPTTASSTSSGSLSPLTTNTTYYVRAYATNQAGTSYGTQLSFITLPTNATTPVASPATICNGSSSGLSVSNPLGSVYWYTANNGTGYVGIGNPLTVNPATTTTYYARNYNASGFSAGYTSGVTVTVNQPATSPATSSATATEKTTASLSWVSSTGLTPITYTWAVGTTTGVTYESGYTARGTTTNPTITASATGLSQSTTYYLRVKASNSCNPSGSAYVTSSSFRTHSLLTYIAGTNGTISGTVSQTIANTGNGAAVTAVPNSGYNFVNWSDGSVVNPRTDLNVTSSITVTANFAANRLVFGTQPVNSIAGASIPITVRITDTYGTTMTSSTASVSIVIVNNPSISGAGVLTGTSTVNAVSGVATFSGLSINKTGVGYTLRVSSPNPIITTPLSGAFNITPAAIDHFTVEGITDPVVAGTTTTPLVTAYDQYNNVKTDYTGTITFTSIDPLAVIPTPRSFVSGDNGVHSFINLLTLKTIGEQTVTVTGDGKTGTQTFITVTPAGLDHFTLSTQHTGTETAGTAFSVTATAIDLFGNIKTNYSGTSNLNWTTTATSSFNGTARIIPSNGNQTFASGVSIITGFTLYNSHQTPTITIKDALTDKSGTTSAITVLNAPLDNFKVVAGTSQAGGVPFDVTVTARDVYWNTCIDYTGSIRFKSSDDLKVAFPVGLQSMAGSNGVKTYSGGVNIDAIGAYWLRAADATFAFKSGEQQNILIGPGAFSPLTAKSVLLVDYTTRVAGEFVTVTITPRDAKGNLLYACRNISVKLNGSTDNLTTISGVTMLRPIIVINNGDGTYTALVRVTTVGSNTISARFNETSQDFEQTRIITVTPANASYLSITGSGTMVSGTSQPVTITAFDEFNNIATGYEGSKALTFSGANVSPTPSSNPTVDGTAFGTPATLTFTSGISTGTMSLYKVETALVSATDGTISSSGHTLAVVVSPAAASYLAVTGTAIQIAGTSQSITVTAYDAYNNVATGYTGSKTLTFSGATAALTIPTATNPTVSGTAFGAATSITFSSGVATPSMLLYKDETALVSSTDGTINSTDHKLSVTVNPATASYLAVTGTATEVAGESQEITITAYDVYNNIASGYTGSKSLTFTGANVSPAPSTSPTIGTTAFGTSTSITFSSGVASGSMTLYKVETALVTATDGTINSNSNKLSVVVGPAIAGYLAITGTGTQVVGASQTITVTAYDAFNNLATGYTDSKALTFSGANLSPAPSDSPTVDAIVLGTTTSLTFSSGISTGSMILYKSETALVTTTDGTINSDLHKLSVVVSPGAASYLAVTGNATQIAGASQTITIKAYDASNNVATGYTGSKALTFSGASVSPAPVTNPTIGGTVFGTSKTLTFTAGVATGSMILYKTETALVTSTDGTINADAHNLSVLVNPALLKDFLVSDVPSPHDLNTWVSVTVEARDTYNNRKTNYAGSVTFSNTDINATDPLDYHFLPADLGIHVFVDEEKFSAHGNWWLTAMDVNEPAKYGYQANIIVRRAVIITANNRTKTYGDGTFALGTTEFTVSPASPEITGVTLTSTGSVATAGVNTYSITPSLATGSTYNSEFYNIVYTDGTLTVEKRPLVLSSFTAENKVYDGTTSVTGTGFSNNMVSGDDLTFTYTSAFADKDAGTAKTVNYTGITISGGASADNYLAPLTTGTATANITPLPVVVTPYSGITKVYGSVDPAIFSYSYSPVLLGADAITGSMGRSTGEDVGDYTFGTGSLTAGGNYSLTVAATPTFSITKAILTVTAEDKSRCYSGVAVNTVTYSGFVNGDTKDNLDGSLAFTGTSIGAVNQGSYSIIPSGLTSSDYTIIYVNGNLIINPLPVPVISGSATICAGSTANVYTTESGMTGYIWSVSGVLNTDYTITSGGGTGNNTITIAWITGGSKTVSVNYTNVNGCSAGTATEFDVTVNPITVGGTLTSGVTEISLGQSTGAISLSAQTGSVVRWEKRFGSDSWSAVSNTSTTFSATPNVVGTWEYRAVVQSGSCPEVYSSSTSVVVNTSDAGAVTGGSSPICSGSPTGTMTLAGYTGTILKWQSSVDNWVNIVEISNTNTTYTETPSAPGTWEYRAVVNNGTIDLTSAPTEIVVVSATVVKGSVAGGTTICSGSTSGVLTLSGNTGTVAKWQSSTDDFVTFSDINNTLVTYTSGPLAETTKFRAVVQSGICVQDFSVATTVTVAQATVAGAVSGGTIACTGNTSGLLTLSDHNGTVIKWQSSVSPFTSWTDISNATTSYTSDPLTQTTQFRAVVQNGSCSVVNSETTTVTVNPSTVGGSLSGRSTPILLGQSTGTITLSGQTGSVVRWEKRLGSGSWSAVSNILTTFSATPNVIGTWEYRAVVKSGTCSETNSGSVSVLVLTSDAGAVTGGTSPICLNGATGTMTLAGYTGTIIKWQKRVNSGLWSDITNTTTTYTEIPTSEGIWEYHAIINNGSDLTSAPTEIIVSPASNGGTISGSATVCSGTNSTLLTISGYDGSVQKWQSSVDDWANIVDIEITTATYTAVNLTATTKYRVVVSGICFPVNSGEAVVTVDPVSVGGSVAGAGTITYGNATGTLTLTGRTGIVQKWQRKLNTGSWVDITASSDTYTEIPSASGTWHYRAVVISGACSEANSSEVIVTVDKKELTVTGATVTSKPYDGNNTATITNATLSGVVGLDDVILGNQTSGTFAQVTVGTAISVTTSPMTITGAGVSNYTLTLPVLTGVITAKPIVVTSDTQTKVYGDTDPTLTYTFVPALITGDSFTGSLTRVAGENVGSYSITLGSLALSANYTLSYTNAALSVTSKPISVTANAQIKVYGDTDPTLTYTLVPALISGDSFTGLLARVSGENVGTYAISQGNLALSTNYTLTVINGVMTINKATLTVTADNKVKTYGGANPAMTVAYLGFKGADDRTVIDTPPVISTSAVQYSIPGIFSIIPSGATDNNYLFTYVNGTLTISKASIRFTADDKTKNYLEANPALTYSVSGLLNSETQSVIDVLPSIQTTSVQTSNAGAYPITVSGGSDNCYSFVYQAGVMTIAKIPQVITFNNIDTSMLVQDVLTISASSTSGLPVQFESIFPQFATVDGNQFTGISRGIARIRAFNSGDQNYLPAEIFADLDIISTHRDILHLFTPNGDGFNDTWEILDMQTYGNCDVRVFNRWGKQVYANRHYDNLWEGTSNGAPLPDGAYYFIIKTENSGTITGTLNLVR